MNRRHFLAASGGALLSACPVCLGAAWAAEKGQGHHWAYHGSDGPEHWGKLSPDFKVCEIGTQQSPIAVDKGIRADLGSIGIDYKPMPLRIVNNGHTIQINCDPGSGCLIDGVRYELQQFHFHHPSEHLLEGRSFDLEIHFVHAATDGRLAVLGVLVQPNSDNPALTPILDAMPKEAGKETATGTPFVPATLLPTRRGYFRYHGSLTTPPCSETVLWTVFGHPILASMDQIRKFAALFPGNARPVQPVNRRMVLFGG